MNVLVTGASGFIGGWVAGTVLKRGYTVRALYRRPVMPARLERIRSAGAQVERRDLTSLEDTQQAVRGIDAVLHIAGLTGDWYSFDLFKTMNYDLTVQLLTEAQKSGCKVFIYTSSIAVHGFGRHVNTTEDGPYYHHINPYQVTKKMAEDYVLSENSKTFRTGVIRPGNVYGPGDTTMFYRLLDAQEKGVKGTLGGGKSLTCPVYVEDLVEAILLCLEKEASAGQVFNITGGETVTWNELLTLSASLLGVKPWLELPIPIAGFLACILSGIYNLFGIRTDPPLTRYRVDQVSYDYHFSIDKAKDVLGYIPKVDWNEGLHRTVEAYRREVK